MLNEFLPLVTFSAIAVLRLVLLAKSALSRNNEVPASAVMSNAAV